MTRELSVIALPMGDLTFPSEGPYAGQTVEVVAYAVRHEGGIFLFDTGFREAAPDDPAYLRSFFAKYALRTRPLTDSLADAGIDPGEVTAVANCHLHFDHAGQNSRFPGIPIYVQSAELAATHKRDYTLPEVHRFPGAAFELVDGEREVAAGIRIIATPGHSPGHQSLVLETEDGLILLVGQAVYSHGEWVGLEGARDGTPDDPSDREAYRRSIARLRALNPKRVLFGHDRRGWPD